MSTARDVRLEVDRLNIALLPNVIAIRDKAEVIRLSDPSPYRDELLMLAKVTVDYMHRRIRPAFQGIVINIIMRDVRIKTNMLRGYMRNLETKRQTRDLANRALVRLFPSEIRRCIASFSGMKAV